MNNTIIPLTRATNSYDLLTEIRRLALEEPKRINMCMVLLTGKEIDKYKLVPPRCGTVGCVAGWVLVKTGNDHISDTWHGMHAAAQILGIGSYLEGELFRPDHLMRGSKHKVQTRAHAREVNKHIREFQAKYKEQLMNHKINLRVE